MQSEVGSYKSQKDRSVNMEELAKPEDLSLRAPFALSFRLAFVRKFRSLEAAALMPQHNNEHSASA